MSKRMRGVLAPVVTPFGPDGKVDVPAWVRHCRWLQANDSGLAVFGTNSEANSLGLAERLELLEQLVAAGLDTERMMPGTGCCALPDTVQLSARAVALGCAGVLMLPPFYYKGVSDEGLYRYYADVIEQVGDARLRIYLYHIPPVSQVGLGVALIERLLARYPDQMAGIKDSSGDWNNTAALLQAFSGSDFRVFVGSETFLLQNLRRGGAGCISSLVNIAPQAIHRLYNEWELDDAEAQQQALNRLRAAFQGYSPIPALKNALAHWSGHGDWARVRPPLVELDAAQSAALNDALRRQGFSIDGWND
jgi:4-hydroxy-tetrahydrodipicolinate synthase